MNRGRQALPVSRCRRFVRRKLNFSFSINAHKVCYDSATTYYLYDEAGGASPLLEETYSGSTATVSMGYGMAEDGLRARYAPASGGLYYLFQWDPQGSLVQRQTGGAGGNTSYYALDTAIFDWYGVKLGDTDAFTGGAEGARDSIGFQGQFGAYTDNETGLVLMGHRYYVLLFRAKQMVGAFRALVAGLGREQP